MRTGSIVECNVLLERPATDRAPREAFRATAAAAPPAGFMGVLEEERAALRVVGDTISSMVDLPLPRVIDGRLLSVAAWSDDEMGYARRLAETAVRLAAA